VEDIPYWDDYMFISVIDNIENSDGVYEIFQELFRPHNEHAIFVSKLIFYLQFLITGSINYKLVALVGLCLLYIIVYILFITSEKLIRNDFLPIVFMLLFIPINNITNWAMVSVGWYGTILFSILSFYFLGKFLECYHKFFLLAAIFFMILAPFSMANGILVGVISVFVFIQHDWEKIKVQLLPLSIYIFFTVATLILIYHISFKEKSGEPFKIESGAVNKIFEIGQHYLLFLASPMKDLLNNNISLLTMVGLLLFLFIGFLCFKIKNTIIQYPFYYMLLLFMLFSMGLISLGRSHISVDQALRTRYTVMPIMLWIVLARMFILYCEKYKVKFNFRYFHVILFVFFVNKIAVHYEQMKERSLELHNGIISFWGERNSENLAFPQQKIGSAAARLKIGEKRQIYSSKKVLNSTKIISDLNYEMKDFTPDFHFRIKFVSSSEDLLFIKGWCFPKDIEHYNFYIQINDGKRSITFMPNRVKRNDAAKFILDELNLNIKDKNLGFEVLHPIFKKHKNEEKNNVYLIIEDTNTKIYYRKLIKSNKKLWF